MKILRAHIKGWQATHESGKNIIDSIEIHARMAYYPLPGDYQKN